LFDIIIVHYIHHLLTIHLLHNCSPPQNPTHLTHKCNPKLPAHSSTQTTKLSYVKKQLARSYNTHTCTHTRSRAHGHAFTHKHIHTHRRAKTWRTF